MNRVGDLLIKGEGTGAQMSGKGIPFFEHITRLARRNIVLVAYESFVKS